MLAFMIVLSIIASFAADISKFPERQMNEPFKEVSQARC
jgi:hypothetical protein